MISKELIVAIAGCKEFKNYSFFEEKCYEVIASFLEKDYKITIRERESYTVDNFAVKFANENNVAMTVFKPDFEKFGRGAALARNTQIIQKSDVVFAFWDGKSKGTHDSIKKAEKLNKRLLIFNY